MVVVVVKIQYGNLILVFEFHFWSHLFVHEKKVLFFQKTKSIVFFLFSFFWIWALTENGANTTYHHIPTNTKHNTHFQHRYRPTSFHVARGLHRKHQDSCFLHDANMSDRQGMGHGPRTLTLRQVRAVFTERADWKSDHCQRAVKRETREEERGRHERRETREEKRETFPCVR